MPFEPAASARFKAPAGAPSPSSGLKAGPRRPVKRRRIEHDGTDDPFVQEVGPSPAAIRMQQLRARVQAKEAAARAEPRGGQVAGEPGRGCPSASHSAAPERVTYRLATAAVGSEEAPCVNSIAVQQAMVPVERIESAKFKAPAGAPSPSSGLEAGPRRPEKRRRIERDGTADPFVQEVGPSPAAIKMQQLRARVQAKEAAARARSSAEGAL